MHDFGPLSENNKDHETIMICGFKGKNYESSDRVWNGFYRKAVSQGECNTIYKI